MIVWIVSYPRSGNTFFRILLNRVFGIKTCSIYNDRKCISSHEKTRSYVGHEDLPDDFDLEEIRKSKKNYYIKTHELLKNMKLSDLDKVIYLIRDGRESCLSFSKYLQYYNEKKGNVLGDVLCGKTAFGSWSEHVRQWKNVDKLLIKFEDLIENPLEVSSIVEKYLNIKPVNYEMPTFEELHSFNPSFFRSGQKDSWKKNFSEEEELIFWKNNVEEMISLGYTNDMPNKFNKKYLKNNMQDSQLIFLISQPRSGSTLLQKILGAHSKIYTRSEPWLMLYPLYSLKNQGVYTEYDYKLGQMGLSDFCSGLPNGRQSYVNELKQMYLNLYSYYINETDHEYFLDKTPRYYLIANELLEVFPNAKFILLIRNPLAMLGSIINTWIKDDWKHLFKHKYDIIDAIDSYIDILDNKNFFIVHYEDLLFDTENKLKAIFSYLDIKYENISQDYNKNGVKWQFGDQINVYSKKEIDKKNHEKWRENLYNPQYWRVMFEYLNYIGKERFERLGYNFNENKIILEKNMPTQSMQYIMDNTISLFSLLDNGNIFADGKDIDEIILEKNQEISDKNIAIKNRDTEIEKKAIEIESKKQEIGFMKSSKFWKLREFYLNIKNKLRGHK